MTNDGLHAPELGLHAPELGLRARAMVQSAGSDFCVCMRPSSSSGLLPLLPASNVRAGLVRWLVLLLLVFDQFSAPWHGHHHDSGAESIVAVAAHAGVHAGVHADVTASEALAQIHAEAPDHPSTWAHAATVLRSEVGQSLAMVDDSDDGRVPSWPTARLTPAIEEPSRLALANPHLPPTPLQRGLWPSPQAPPSGA